VIEGSFVQLMDENDVGNRNNEFGKIAFVCFGH
jgi:hypothetical protein